MNKNNLNVLEAFKILHNKLENEEVLKINGSKVVEIINCQLILDPKYPIVTVGSRKTPINYAIKEVEWYDSMCLSVNEIGKLAKIWTYVCDVDGNINSNYGWCIYSKENYEQYNGCLNTLLEDKNSRRATMIYNRPSMQTEYNKNGMNDFICTYYSAFFIRNNKLINIVTMRSNDAIYGFFNDFYWHCEVYKRLYADLLNKYTGLEYDNMYWRADSFHVYERHFKLLEKIIKETEDENNKNQTG